MEDLIDIISKKEQTMKDLEKLKSEKAKIKVFMESLKKINKQEAQQPISCSAEVSIQPGNHNITHKVVEVEENKTTSPTHSYRQQQSPYMHNSHLPDLVNHEKYFRKQDNPESQSTIGHLGN